MSARCCSATPSPSLLLPLSLGGTIVVRSSLAPFFLRDAIRLTHRGRDFKTASRVAPSFRSLLIPEREE